MKTSRFKFEYRDSASKLHKEVGDCLRTHPLFSTYPLYQEYPLSRISSFSGASRLHFDWVIPKLKLVIEVHGSQHYKPTSFGGDKTEEEVLEDFRALQNRDSLKKEAALAAGYKYIEVPYTMAGKINDSMLYKLYQEADEYKDWVKPEEPVEEVSDYRERLKDKARAQRKKQRKAMKAKKWDY